MMSHDHAPTRRAGASRTTGALLLGCLAVHGAFAAASDECSVTVTNDLEVAELVSRNGITPGSTVCIGPGTYSKPVVLTGWRGTARQPIRLLARPAGTPPRLAAGLVLRNVSYVEVSGLDVSLEPHLSPWAAVILDAGTAHSSVSRFHVHDSYLGISIGSSEGAAGSGNLVADNLVEGNWNTGIGIGPLSDGTRDEPNSVLRNHVLRNGGHGIEITEANYVTVEHNLVENNSTGVHALQQGGYSGIHVFAFGPTSAASPHGVRSTHNRIGFNTVSGTWQPPATQPCRDGSGAGICADGNGIQVDTHTSHTEIYANVVFANAGDGISVYGSKDNVVRDNKVSGNNQQEGRIRLSPAIGEIVVSSENLAADSSSGNAVYGNTAVTTVDRIPAFYQSPNSGRNVVGPSNTWQVGSPARMGWIWGPVRIGSSWYSGAREVDRVTGTTGNVVGVAP